MCSWDIFLFLFVCMFVCLFWVGEGLGWGFLALFLSEWTPTHKKNAVTGRQDGRLVGQILQLLLYLHQQEISHLFEHSILSLQHSQLILMIHFTVQCQKSALQKTKQKKPPPCPPPLSLSLSYMCTHTSPLSLSLSLMCTHTSAPPPPPPLSLSLSLSPCFFLSIIPFLYIFIFFSFHQPIKTTTFYQKSTKNVK